MTDKDYNNLVIHNSDDILGCIERLKYYNSIINKFGSSCHYFEFLSIAQKRLTKLKITEKLTVCDNTRDIYIIYFDILILLKIYLIRKRN